jgi:hypothetical protein
LSRLRSERVIEMVIPVRMRQTRMRAGRRESQSGLFCQTETTSLSAMNLIAIELFQRREGRDGPKVTEMFTSTTALKYSALHSVGK